MDEFSDENIQLAIESEDDTRITLTMVKLDGKKITMAEFVVHLEEYVKEVCEAEAERNLMGASIQ